MKRMFIPSLFFVCVLAALAAWPLSAYSQAPVAADLIMVVDESGSMSGEQRWLREMAPLLESNLKSYGIGSESQKNLYGVVGYLGSPRRLEVGGGLLGSSDEFVEAARGLRTSGGTEDGWRGLQSALDDYPRRNGAALNIILATDEDRDNRDSSITFDSLLDALNGQRTLLNAVVDVRIECENGTRALGMDSIGNGYVADGAGGFSLCDNPKAVSGFGRTIDHYVDMAIQNGGAVWDLNVLRSGGANAESFTQAVLDIKVEEILDQRPIDDLVAVANASPNPAVAGQSVTLDGTNSFHQEDDREIVRWEWDLDDDGSFEASGPKVTTQFPELGEYPVTLRVTDDADSPATSRASVTVDVSTPPLEPTADTGGPYRFCPQTKPWRLDASESVNPDDGQSEPGQPEDRIVSYKWDLDDDQAFDDASGASVDATSQLSDLGVGDHLIRLRTTDNTSNAFPSSGKSDLSDTAVTQVSVLDESAAACNCLTDLAARAKMKKVQLTWTDSGAHQYGVYRSKQEGGPYERIALTDNRYSGYLDSGLELDTTYYYMVRELDRAGQTLCQSREVSVTPQARRLNESNRTPEIVSDPVVEATEGQRYEYAVQAQDPDRRERLTYSLPVSPSGMNINAATGLIEWEPVNAQVGDQTVIVRVTDNQGAHTEQDFVVSVSNVNQAPEIVSSPVTEAVELKTYEYQVEALDPDKGDSLTYALTSAPNGMVIDAATGKIRWTPEEGQAGRGSVSVSVTDNAGETDQQSFEVDVRERNHLPEITSEPPTSATEGEGYTYLVMATDQNDDDTITFGLDQAPAGMTIDPANGLIDWTPQEDQVGTTNVAVSASDSRGGSTSQSFTIEVDEANRTPEILTDSLPQAREDQAYRFTLNAQDPNQGDELEYTLTSGPSNMEINAASGELAWYPVNNQVGQHEVTIRVSDEEGLHDEAIFQVEVENANDSPFFVSQPVYQASVDSAYVYDARADDPDDADTLSYTLVESPDGMSIEGDTGRVEWTPEAGQGGTHPVTIRAADQGGASTEQSFQLTVATSNEVPVVTSEPPATGYVDSVYRYQVVASDPEGASLTYSLDEAPDGVAINNSGNLNWIPSAGQAGEHRISVRVTDERGATATQAFTVTVSATNQRPVIESVPPQGARIDQPYHYDANASDPDGDVLTYVLSQAPSGMSIDSSTGSIQWTPGESQEGTVPVRLDVSDGRGGQTSQTFEIQVSRDNTAPTIVSAPETVTEPDTEYVYQAQANDPDGDPLTFSLEAAPSGMTVDADSGLVLWTPGENQTGEHSVALRVSDSEGGQNTQSFNLVVTDDNKAPVIESAPVTSARVDEPYQYEVQAADPDGDDLEYRLLEAPGGMAIDAQSGTLSWTPGAAQEGSFTVDLVVNDPAGETASQRFTVEVTKEGEPPYLANKPAERAEVGEEYRFKVLAVDFEGNTASVELASGPDGMTLSDDSNIPELRWTPAEGDCTKEVTLALEDRFGQSEQVTFSIKVLAAPKRLNRIQCSKQSQACGD